MKIPRAILETDKVKLFLESRNLMKQYKKAKGFVLAGRIGGTDFKERKPKGSQIWSFRINSQFRSIGYFDEHDNLIITMIDDHS